MIVGILPAVGNALHHLEAHGLLPRFKQHFLWYREWFDRAYYFSYRRDDPAGEFIVSVPKETELDDFRYALSLPFRSPAFRACDVFRVTSLVGCIPALVGRICFNKPFVVSYGVDYEVVSHIHGRGRRQKRFRWLTRVAFALASEVFCPNRTMAQALKWKYPKAHIRYHPNWVDIERFRPAKDRTHGRRVLYVGRFVKEKNLIRLADVCLATRSKLTLVGDGPMFEELENKGAIIWSPQPWDRLPHFYQNTDVFACLSLAEGHNKAWAEAMACGVPCLVSDRISEGLGHVVAAEDRESIIRGLEKLLLDTEYSSDLGRRSRNYAQVHYAEQPLMKEEVSVLAQLARGGLGKSPL